MHFLLAKCYKPLLTYRCLQCVWALGQRLCSNARLWSSCAGEVFYIIPLLSYRNSLDSHLARVCHPFVIRIERPWLLGPRDSSKINWLEMTSARICRWSARRYHEWNHKPLIVCWFIHLSECVAAGAASSPRALSVRLVIHNTFIYLPTASDSQHWGIYSPPAPPLPRHTHTPSPFLCLPPPHLIDSVFSPPLFFKAACEMKWLWRQLSLGWSEINMSMPEEVRVCKCVWLHSE